MKTQKTISTIIRPTAKVNSFALAIAMAICLIFPVAAFSQTVQFIIDYGGKRGQTNNQAVSATPSNTFTVTNLNDSGAGSLRQAILKANAEPGDDTINFEPDLSGTIALTSGELKITDDVTLNAPGANVLTVSGENNSRVFNIFSDYDSPVTAEINGVTISNGNDTSAVSWCGGGILSYFSNLYLNNSVITQNNAHYGGGICQLDGTLEITNSTISNNNAVHDGGGLRFGYNSAIVVLNSTISDNSAASAGGISNLLGTLTIANSTVSHNTAISTLAGGINNNGTINIGNTIVAANQSPLFPDVSGVFHSYGNNLIGIAAGNEGFSDGLGGDKIGTPSNPLNPKLGNLQNNGGTTLTRAILAGSPAINAGNNCVAIAVASGGCVNPPLTTDQRNIGFPRRVSNSVDIGAFESQLTNQPASAEQCKTDGWRKFNNPRVFKNQGDCIQFVNTGK